MKRLGRNSKVLDIKSLADCYVDRKVKKILGLFPCFKVDVDFNMMVSRFICNVL